MTHLPLSLIQGVLAKGPVPTRSPENPAQPADAVFDLLAFAVDFRGPFAELVVGDGGGLAEVVAVEEEAADDGAEDAAGAGVGGGGAFEEDFVDGAGAVFLPEHAGVGVDVAEG